MQIDEFALFPTRMLAIQFSDVSRLNDDLYQLFTTRDEFRGDFDMHPDALNLLKFAGSVPAIAQLRDRFLEGLKRWLRAERATGEPNVDMVLFSNLAAKGEYTLAHNHNADVVGIYYVRTSATARNAVYVPGPDGDYDYFDAEDGALILHDPRFNANLATVRSNDYAKVFPRPGLMLIFPAFLWHSVTPSQSPERRLALSANFSLNWPGPKRAESFPLRLE